MGRGQTSSRGSFNEFLASIFRRGGWFQNRGATGGAPEDLEALCHALQSTSGEASALVYAAEVLDRYDAADAAGRLDFFHLLARDFDVDADALRDASVAFAEERSAPHLTAVLAAAEPMRQEVFRRLNTVPGGTAALVRMRADLLEARRTAPDLERVNADLQHLLTSWFNRGFLNLLSIDWHTPADTLEKIIAYEAVHEIDSWEELRRRLQPEDRRCFAFFHPAMPDEPLIFVEVALTQGVPASIQSLLAPDREIVPAAEADTATFYSISNCQAGLAGISFGNFLIKQVAADLKSVLPNLANFVTLSPVPGFRAWLERRAGGDPLAAEVLAAVAKAHENGAPPPEALSPDLLHLAATYFLDDRRPDGRPLDPVARFHLGNGAQLLGMHARADLSPAGLDRSAGVMVNYLYDLAEVETRHEAFVRTGAVDAAAEVRALLQRPKSRRKEAR